MKINNLYFLICTILCCYGCDKPKESRIDEKSVSECKQDPFYENDIHHNKNTKFKYPPKEFPVIGKTTEKEIYKIDNSVSPTTRSSLKNAIELKIKNKVIKVDKYLEYIDYRKKERRYQRDDGSYTFERIHSDYINYYILLHNEIVVFYTTRHMTKRKNKWIPGKYHNGYAKTIGVENFPGLDYLQCMSMRERPDALCVFGKVYTQEKCDELLKDSRPWR